MQQGFGLKVVKLGENGITEQIEEVKGKKKYHNFNELLMTNDTWEVK